MGGWSLAIKTMLRRELVTVSCCATGTNKGTNKGTNRVTSVSKNLVNVKFDNAESLRPHT